MTSSSLKEPALFILIWGENQAGVHLVVHHGSQFSSGTTWVDLKRSTLRLLGFGWSCGGTLFPEFY